MVDKKVDVLIAGGGLTGMILLLCLQNRGYEALLIEAKPLIDKVQPDFDARTLALSPASVRLFQALHLWADMQTYACPVNYIHVSEAGCFGATRLNGTPEEPLGYVIEMQHLNEILTRHLAEKSVIAPGIVSALEENNHIAVINTPEKTLRIQADLIVAADGADSALRSFCSLSCQTKIWDQSAIVANIALEKPHAQQAFERFTKEGALALLPMQDNRSALVWSLKTANAECYMQLSDTEFLTTVQKTFGYRLGRMQKAGKRTIWPLKQVIMPEQAAWPLVFIGNAAHTLHPVAAQGFNLGLRDVAALVQCIAEQALTPEMLKTYQQRRSHDQSVIIQGTNILAEWFTLPIPGLWLARNAGMIALDNIPALKRLFTRYARGFGGYIPDLLCEGVHHD